MSICERFESNFVAENENFGLDFIQENSFLKPPSDKSSLLIYAVLIYTVLIYTVY